MSGKRQTHMLACLNRCRIALIPSGSKRTWQTKPSSYGRGHTRKPAWHCHQPFSRVRTLMTVSSKPSGWFPACQSASNVSMPKHIMRWFVQIAVVWGNAGSWYNNKGGQNHPAITRVLFLRCPLGAAGSDQNAFSNVLAVAAGSSNKPIRYGRKFSDRSSQILSVRNVGFDVRSKVPDRRRER